MARRVAAAVFFVFPETGVVVGFPSRWVVVPIHPAAQNYLRRLRAANDSQE